MFRSSILFFSSAIPLFFQLRRCDFSSANSNYESKTQQYIDDDAISDVDSHEQILENTKGNLKFYNS